MTFYNLRIGEMEQMSALWYVRMLASLKYQIYFKKEHVMDS